ncbi:alr0857 family protein [Tumidithrix helvetica PCC 7403]|uniref:alr0857 family protein n=1 Tax=Tumidithrix helvetica TaxID=3457545 RepID=UPI003C7F7D37
MLKLIFTENGLYVEKLDIGIDEFINTRVAIARCASQPIAIGTSSASMLLPNGVPTLTELVMAINQEAMHQIAIDLVDSDCVEVSIARGHWITSTPDAEIGIFAVTLSDRIESALFKLWQFSMILLPLSN